MKIYTDVDLRFNQLTNVRIQDSIPTGTLPKGTIYYDENDNRVKYWTGTGWINIGYDGGEPPPGGDGIKTIKINGTTLNSSSDEVRFGFNSTSKSGVLSIYDSRSYDGDVPNNNNSNLIKNIDIAGDSVFDVKVNNTTLTHDNNKAVNLNLTSENFGKLKIKNGNTQINEVNILNTGFTYITPAIICVAILKSGYKKFTINSGLDYSTVQVFNEDSELVSCEISIKKDSTANYRKIVIEFSEELDNDYTAVITSRNEVLPPDSQNSYIPSNMINKQNQ